MPKKQDEASQEKPAEPKPEETHQEGEGEGEGAVKPQEEDPNQQHIEEPTEFTKTLILISSVMTWVNTPAKEKKPLAEGEEEPAEGEGEEEEPEDEEEVAEDGAEEGEEGAPVKKKILPFKESDFYLRIPSTRFQPFKTLEVII